MCVLFWFFVFFESRRIPFASSRLGFGAQQTETDLVVVVEVVVLSIVNCLFSREGAELLFVCLFVGIFPFLFLGLLKSIFRVCLFVCPILFFCRNRFLDSSVKAGCALPDAAVPGNTRVACCFSSSTVVIEIAISRVRKFVAGFLLGGEWMDAAVATV